MASLTRHYDDDKVLGVNAMSFCYDNSIYVISYQALCLCARFWSFGFYLSRGEVGFKGKIPTNPN